MTAPDDARDLTRIRSDYIGAGAYVVTPDDEAVIVNTDYGIQAVGLDGVERWRVDLVERCLGIAWNEEGLLLASTMHALHRISRDGNILDTRPTRHPITRNPIPWRDSVFLATRTRVYQIGSDGEVRWRYRLRESLGESISDVFVIDVFPSARGTVIGAVDHDTGIGRVIVLDGDGRRRWQSEPGPLTEVFPVSHEEVVYTLSGYGRFESYRADWNGEIRWKRQLGGPGVELHDGRIAFLIGNNEAPTWDNWELRITDAEGDPLERVSARGRSAQPPVVGPDGALYFSTFLRPFDPSESRVDYTSYVRQPRYVAYDHLWKRPAPPRFNVFYQRYELGGSIETLFEDRESLALGPVVAGRERVFLVHDNDLLAIDASRQE